LSHLSPLTGAAPASLTLLEEPLPALSGALRPPFVIGPAALTTAAMQGTDLTALLAEVHMLGDEEAARAYDISVLHQLAFQPETAACLQAAALTGSHLFRVRRHRAGPPAVRVLALMSPGDLMANTPLDFITNHLDVQLDMLFMVPSQALPDTVPDHDVMIFASSEPDPVTSARMASLFRRWPRPVLNDPALQPGLARDRLSASLTGLPSIFSPTATVVARDALEAIAGGLVEITALMPGVGYPVLVRPIASHAGIGLEKIDGPEALVSYLGQSGDDEYYLTPFVDYRSADGLYRKYRVAFMEGAPFLCHMAASEHWMLHYLNAGMTRNTADGAAKRAAEAAEMESFDTGFVARHSGAFCALHDALGFDFYSVDCSELPDGRLLVFEADTAAIIHLMDPIDLFPYKHVQMPRVFEAFEAMLRRRIASAGGA
jgi:hypothetical protein